ncbi:MAG: 50S ribosome-binding GTPase, partial [Candidatus Krumholzibacteria bacterium]|nr:50S ribosome-binding GTPase [Candidatus Krumholzibacteria bacterium]
RAVSRAEPIVAPYPFSTVAPTLGIVRVDEAASFCMVDIPGLIEGAHEGKGLGLEFLRHIERCRVLLLIIDAASSETAPADAYRQLLEELRLYSETLLERPRLVALNKVDMVPGGADSDAVRDFRAGAGEDVFAISALSGEGVGALIKDLYRAVLDASDAEREG